ncbi:MAG: YbaY family lipoprotein [Dehalococcoidia bacterium]|nr:YbaY family lipoprotein [Dehalococcoidia bacterium]
MKNKYVSGLAALGGILVLTAGIACGSEPGPAAPGGIETGESQPTEPADGQPVEPVDNQPGEPADDRPTEPVDEQPADPADNVEMAHVTGTIAYLQRIALTPEASVVVKLLDVSRADAPSITLSEQVIDNPGQVPVEFDLPFDQAEIDSRFTYVVRAEIFEAGELVFTTTMSYPVITRESPTEVDLILEKVSSGPSDGDEPVAGDMLCMTTLASQLPIEFVSASDAISTAFDGINVANCTFPEEIQSVRVTISNNETGAKHVQVFSLPESSAQVSFPLGEDVLSMGTAEIVAPGEYSRVLEAISMDGEVYDLTAGSGALDSVTVLPAETEEPVVLDAVCMTTLASQLPIEFGQAGDPISTAFDGVNIASCTFTAEIETIEVTITHTVSGATHTQVFSLPEPATDVSFPLGDDALSIGTLEILEPGEYQRVLVAVSADGRTYDLTAGQGALDTVTVTG